MMTKILSASILAAVLTVFAVPVASFAADVPKTKEECEKLQDMKWDDATQTCVKK